MAISLRPMSFHCASTACVGLAAALGASCFFAESCATAGSTANPAPSTRLATTFHFFISFLLRFARKPDVLSFRRTTLPGVSPSLPWFAVYRPPRGFILRSKIAPVMQIPKPRMLNLYFRLGGRHHRELGLSAAAHCHRFRYPDAALSLAAILVPRPLARHFALGSGTP